MIIIFSLELESIEGVDSLVNCILILLNLSIGFVYNVGVSFHLFFDKLDHEHSVLCGSFIKKYNRVSVYCFIKDYILDLTLALQLKAPSSSM